VISKKTGDTHITIIVPGLLGSLQGFGYSDMEFSRLDSIETLLSKAEKEKVPEQSYETSLFSQFTLDLPSEADIPVAAITRTADTGSSSEGWWLRIDPVHLYPDRDQLLLFGPRVLEIMQHEADALVEQLNALYAEDEWIFDAPHPERWYLKVSHAPGIKTVPLDQVIGRDINLHLPSGSEGKSWHGIMTEMQMLMHSSSINQQRESGNQLTINSVWCWGGGCVPEGVKGHWDHIWSNDPISTGMAMLANIPCSGLPGNPSKWMHDLSAGEHLVILDQLPERLLYEDAQAWLQTIHELEEDWFAPLLDSLKSNHFQSLELVTCDGRKYRIEGKHLKRFWKMKKRFKSFLQS
jgi:hypothetical protein